ALLTQRMDRRLAARERGAAVCVPHEGLAALATRLANADLAMPAVFVGKKHHRRMCASGEGECSQNGKAAATHLATTVMMNRVPCGSISESGVSICIPHALASAGMGSQRLLVILPVTTAIVPCSTL